MFSWICALNKRLSKQSWGWWFETPSRSLWRHCNATRALHSRSVISMPTPVHVHYIPRNMHTVFALLCFVVVIHWLIFPYPSGLLHWHCGNLTIAPVPAKQPWWIWINASCEFIMNDCITTTKQSTAKPCAYFLGYTVCYNFQLSMRLFIRQSNIPFRDISMHQDENTLWCLCHKNDEIDRYSG